MGRQRGPFELIVDLAVGKDAWLKAKKYKLLSKHGLFLAFTADSALLEIHNLRQTPLLLSFR
jgi:hypothetical protein